MTCVADGHALPGSGEPQVLIVATPEIVGVHLNTVSLPQVFPPQDCVKLLNVGAVPVLPLKVPPRAGMTFGAEHVVFLTFVVVGPRHTPLQLAEGLVQVVPGFDPLEQREQSPLALHEDPSLVQLLV